MDDDIKTILERDRYHDIADELTDAISTIFDVDFGEHSSANCPWNNALEYIEENATFVKEALEKQTPKKIVFHSHQCHSYQYMCPSCGEDGVDTFAYCPHCGRKLRMDDSVEHLKQFAEDIINGKDEACISIGDFYGLNARRSQDGKNFIVKFGDEEFTIPETRMVNFAKILFEKQ